MIHLKSLHLIKIPDFCKRMKSNTRLIFVVLLMGVIVAFSLIGSDYYLRDRIFGANIFLFPLCFIVFIALGLTLINRTNGYTPNFIKSLCYAVVISFFGSSIFSLYWIRNLNFTFTMWWSSFIDKFVMGLMISLVLAFLYRNK